MTKDYEDYEALEEEERNNTLAYIALLIKKSKSSRTEVVNAIKSWYNNYSDNNIMSYAEARKWVSSSDHRKRLTVLLSIINTEMKRLNVELTDNMRDMLTDIIMSEYTFFGETPESVDKLLSEPWGSDENTWSDRIDNDIVKWLYTLIVVIKHGLVKKQPLNEVIDNIEDKFDSIERQLETLANTESSAMGSIARHDLLKAKGYSKYTYYTSADERTCEICGSMHGLVFPMSAYEVGVTASPMHPNCRCWEIPFS